ncbi:MAG: hypothetical protein EKK37_04005 [Sphingobacteriales bacterium]|nr:MAG: hypothetical protein EKK37_04005 [Sphingobacteriales bacterium]
MKQLFAFVTILLSTPFLQAQDVITLRTGESINAKVSEVGISEVRYFKSSNLNGPLYVIAKAGINNIVYENGNKDVFNATTQQPSTVIVEQPAPLTVYAEQPVRRRNFWNSGCWYPFVVTHIDIGHHGGYYYGGHHGGHGGHH